jgi:arylsulfatase A-like enzyme
MTRSRLVRLALVSVFAAACIGGITWSLGSREAIDQPGLGSLPPGLSRSALNLLVVTLDTTRADHLGAYGFQSISTPNIDGLARDGVLFLQTSAAAPLTMPAHASLYTGRFPFGHGVRDNGDSALDPGQTTLAEVLQEHGYETGAFVSSVVLASSRGLNQGFDLYKDDFSLMPGGLRRQADEVTDDALRWLARAGSSRFFAWLHFYDAHTPYHPRSPYLESYPARPYDAQIAFMDEQVGRVLDFLRQADLLDRTIVVVIADHGEGLGDHREAGHGIFVYDSVMRVPLIIRTPFTGLRARNVDAVTRSVDVMPTLLDLLDLPAPDDIDGRSLVPLMTGQLSTLNLDAYSESMYPRLRLGWSDLRALRTGSFKVIAAPRPELYDLTRDPFEEHNLFDTNRALAGQMIARLREIEASVSTSRRSRAPKTDADTLAKLASLGYVSRPGAPPATDLSDLPDPKDQIGTLNPGGLP